MPDPTMRPLTTPAVPTPVGSYALGMEVAPGARLLFISGQIPEERSGTVPTDFEAQCRLAWRHVGSVLEAAGLGYDALVKVTTFLADRSHAEVNGRVRREVLGAHAPALTVVAASLLDPRWQLEIEAIAAAPPARPTARGQTRSTPSPTG